jgi:hypothetical protein
MKYLKLAPVFLAAAVGSASPALAGVAGVITTVVGELSDVVTYSTDDTKPLTTKVGYKVTISNTGGNTVNNVVFTGSTQVLRIDSAGNPVIPLQVNDNEKAYFVEANDDGGACGMPTGTSTSITCNLGQLRAAGSAGSSRTFAVFFKGPVKSNTCFVAGGPNCEAVKFAGVTNYSEGTNDSTNVNDESAWTGPANVPLGTANPRKVKSALSKSGGDLFTGADGVPSPLTFKFAAKLNAPQLPQYTTATLDLKPVTEDPDFNNLVSACVALGNFNNCYQAGVIVPLLAPLEPNLINPELTKFLTIILRIDSTEVKSPFRKQNIVVVNVNDASNEETVQPCGAYGLPPVGFDRCVFDIQRYPNSGSNGELRGDVEVVIHAYRNAPYRIR